MTRWRRRKDAAAPLSSLWVDLDHDDMPPLFPTPTAIIESSPGRLQCYWRLTVSIPPIEGEQLNRRLAHTLAADPSGYDLTQLLRVPYTTNHKYWSRPTVRLLALTDIRYEPAELTARLADVPLPDTTAARNAVTSTASLTNSTEPPVLLPTSALPVWAGIEAKRTRDDRLDRSASLVRIARLLYDAGASREAIVAALAERDATLGWRKYTDRTDAAEQYVRVAALVQQGAATKARPLARSPHRPLPQSLPIASRSKSHHE